MKKSSVVLCVLVYDHVGGVFVVGGSVRVGIRVLGKDGLFSRGTNGQRMLQGESTQNVSQGGTTSLWDP